MKFPLAKKHWHYVLSFTKNGIPLNPDQNWKVEWQNKTLSCTNLHDKCLFNTKHSFVSTVPDSALEWSNLTLKWAEPRMTLRLATAVKQKLCGLSGKKREKEKDNKNDWKLKKVCNSLGLWDTYCMGANYWCNISFSLNINHQNNKLWCLFTWHIIHVINNHTYYSIRSCYLSVLCGWPTTCRTK